MNSIVKKTAHAHLPTHYGLFVITVYQTIDKAEQVALTMGDVKKQPIITRIHSKCLTGDTFLSLRCDCHDQLKKSFEAIQKAKNGIIIYLNQEGRGIGLTDKIKAYVLQEGGMDTVDANTAQDLPADARDYKIAADILKDLGVTEISLLTNNPDKVKDLKKHGIKIIKQVPLEIKANKFNKNYLLTKKNKFGHLLKNV